MKELVIKIKWGGLGDHLLHTPIPRVAKSQGYDRVLISNHSDYLQKDTKNFIWERNPFIDGFSDEDRSYPQFGEVPHGTNILDHLILWWGLEDDGIQFREPEIFYQPKTISELKNAVIFDPNYGTSKGHPSGCLTKKYFENKNIKITHQMKPFTTGTALKNIQNLEARNLEHFSDIIFSCKQLICLTTGTATLAAAIGKPTTVLYCKDILPMFHHSKLHLYEKLA